MKSACFFATSYRASASVFHYYHSYSFYGRKTHPNVAASQDKRVAFEIPDHIEFISEGESDDGYEDDSDT
jgi:hypothetical protein